MQSRLEAGEGLAFVAGDPEWRIAWTAVPYRFRLRPTCAPSAAAPSFEASVAWPRLFQSRRLAGGAPLDMRTYGHHYCEFALPVNDGANATGFLFAPLRGRHPATLLRLGRPDIAAGGTRSLPRADHRGAAGGRA